MYMIIVVGAGIAGMVATRRLSMQGHKPVWVSAAAPPAALGETLSERGVRFLNALGWSGALDATVALPSQGRFSVWGSAGLRTVQDEDGQGYLVDKARLEDRLGQWLQRDIQGAQRARVQRVESLSDGVRAVLDDGSVLQGQALIDCTGRAAISSDAQTERRRLDRLVAVWRVFDLPEHVQTLSASLVEAVELGWWYMSPMPGQRMMVALFSDADLLPESLSRDAGCWSGLARSSDAVRVRLESLGIDCVLDQVTPTVSAAASTLASCVVQGRILRAGDAVATMDPLAATGLATALWSGVQSADAALALLKGDAGPAHRYEKDYLLGLVHHLNSQHALYGMEQRYAGQPFWQRRHRPLD